MAGTYRNLAPVDENLGAIGGGVMRDVRRLVLILLFLSLELDGCRWLVAGGAGEAGYVAGQDQSAGTTEVDRGGVGMNLDGMLKHSNPIGGSRG